MSDLEPPSAIVLNRRITSGLMLIEIQCPYCHRKHVHQAKAPGKQWFAPRCGILRTPEQRITGYTFDTRPGRSTQTPRTVTTGNRAS